MKNILWISLLMTAVNASASSICEGEVDRVQLTRGGYVELISNELYGSSEGRRICNMSSSWNIVTPETCKGWYSLVLASIAQQSAIRIQYNEGGTCAEQPIWADSNSPWMLSNI
ncbi:hypothetical protein ACJJI3_07450 [Microbulbifer sp. ZKSA004]|uniref:hypothetical protein n=1 Tax=Microbulbifer sp. ZKSA004 TaxID=3243389 RepID=UPI0040390565